MHQAELQLLQITQPAVISLLDRLEVPEARSGLDQGERTGHGSGVERAPDPGPAR